MSNKGAIRKSLTSKEPLKTSSKSKTRNVSSNEDPEVTGKVDSKDTKKHRTYEQRGDGDKKARVTPSSTVIKARMAKSSGKPMPQKPLQSKSIGETGLGSKSTRNKLHANASSSTKTMSEASKKNIHLSNNPKVRDKNRVGYSEKRGLSTVYMPQSTVSKLSGKSVDRRSRETKSVDTMLVEKEKPSGHRERKLSRTLSPSEVKMLHSAVRRTGSSQRVDSKGKQSEPSGERQVADAMDENYDYEDDFEEYESDFQDCTDTDEISEESTCSRSSLQAEPIELRTAEHRKTVNSAELRRLEEEHMLDSGHYELAEARKRAARIESIIASQSKASPLLELRQPVNKAYSEERQSEIKSLPSSTDEGFEDGRSGDFTKSPPISQISFVDFRKTKGTSAKKAKKRSRGEVLLEMIKLDTMEWSLLECSPIPYEEFISCYGKLNAQQMATQTGEDNIDVETQTEELTSKNKWVQFPVTCRSNLRTMEDVELFKMDHLGVGSDNKGDDASVPAAYDVLRLNDFVSRAGRVMLTLLEERKLGGNVFQSQNHGLPFSDGAVRLSVNSVTFLADRMVTMIHYSDVLNKVLLSIHSPTAETETSSKKDHIANCCIGCVWNISQPSMPIKLFYSACPITACCFHLTNYNVVFAGLQDGSINLWDLNEDKMWHQSITDEANELDWTVRTATYTTAANADVDAHNSQIVSIRVLSKIEEKSFESCNNKFVPIQICSLDEDGTLIVWSILQNMKRNTDDLGLSYWGDWRLVKSQEIPLQLNVGKTKTDRPRFVDMQVDRVNTNNIYVATDTTSVVRATCIGSKSNPKQYETRDTNPSGNVTCIEVCPFDRSFFLVGCDDGSIRLHALNIEKPILQLKDEQSAIGVKAVQWSKSKPFTIYILDGDSRIQTWDLNKSDIRPSETIDTNRWGRVSSIELSPCRTDHDLTQQYLALATESGSLEVHQLNSDYCYAKQDECSRELNTFLRYVEIL